MKDYKQMTFDELAAAKREANDKLGELYVKAANRELKEEEKQEELNLTRELKMIKLAIDDVNATDAHERNMGEHRSEAMCAQLRELLQDCRTNPGKAQREILLAPGNNSDGTSNVTGNITASGAINLTIHDLIPTLHEGLGLPDGLNIVTGVEGNEIWPVSINDVEMEEVGEIEALSDQVLNFANITPTVRHVGLTVPISNMAIDNAAFDLMGFVQSKFTIAMREYWAKKIYSRAPWVGNKGAFAGLAPQGVITIGNDTYKQILKAVAEFSDKGFFEGNVCLSMDRVTEAELMATPKIAGAAGGFVIENGKCCGYPYTVSHYVNTEFNADGKLVAGKGRYLLVGYYEWFAAQTHGAVRMTIDSTSQAVAKRNLTAVTLNLAASMTDLSTKINGANGKTQAFGCYAVLDAPTTPEVLAGEHAVLMGKGETHTLTAVCNVPNAVITYAVTTALSGTSVNSSTGVITAGSTAGTAVITVTATLPDESTVTDTVSVVVA